MGNRVELRFFFLKEIYKLKNFVNFLADNQRSKRNSRVAKSIDIYEKTEGKSKLYETLDERRIKVFFLRIDIVISFTRFS